MRVQSELRGAAISETQAVLLVASFKTAILECISRSNFRAVESMGK